MTVILPHRGWGRNRPRGEQIGHWRVSSARRKGAGRVNLWSVFVTGLLAGGASCTVVQGGLLASAVARRHDGDEDPDRSRLDDAVPVGGFLAGKLVSHTIAGALLGLIGDAAQLGFRTRAFMQIAAGVLMILLAANLLGVRSLRRLVPQPPAAFTRLIPQRARSRAVLP